MVGQPVPNGPLAEHDLLFAHADEGNLVAVDELPERAAAGRGVAEQFHRPCAVPVRYPVWFHFDVELCAVRFTYIQVCGGFARLTGAGDT